MLRMNPPRSIQILVAGIWQEGALWAWRDDRQGERALVSYQVGANIKRLCWCRNHDVRLSRSLFRELPGASSSGCRCRM